MRFDGTDRTVLSVGLGCMHASREVVDAAIAAGVNLVDTADAYGNEAELADLPAHVTIVGKGGLTQPGWVPDGRAKHLAAAARASRDKLGRLDVYLLHAVDPKVPLATSVRALAGIRDDGVARAIGLSNVTRTQLDQALAITNIDAIEIELSPWRPGALRDGLVAACRARGIAVLAHRPLGGAKGAARIAKHARLGDTAARLSPATPHDVVLAWLRHHGVVPIPGATRVETARACARVVELAADDIAALDAAFLSVDAMLGRRSAGESRLGPGNDAAAGREIVVICGIQGSGKTTLAADYVARGYARLNRDDRGGTLAGLAQELDRTLASGAPRVVLDNTYATRSSRAQVLAVARRHGAVAKCIVVDVELERAQLQAAARMLAQHGRLLEPAEIAADKTALPPSALFRFRRQWEPPREDEGWASVEAHVPARRETPGKPALIVELDGLLWTRRPRGPDDIDGDRLAVPDLPDHVLVATTWLPDVSADTFAAIRERLLARFVDVERCAHPAGPPVCWCRKPLPGMALVLARRHGLDLARSIVVGVGPADRGFAERIGARFVTP